MVRMMAVRILGRLMLSLMRPSDTPKTKWVRGIVRYYVSQ